MSEQMTVDELRRVASEWHGGQTSALYAFSSSGTVVDGASLEADRVVSRLEGGYDPGTGDEPAELLREARALATHLQREEWCEQARELGREAGRNAGSWAADGNTSAEHIRKVLTMIEDGDPEADDFLPRKPNLSGEFADDPTPRSVALDIIGEDYEPDDRDALCDAWEDGVRETFMDACVAELRGFLPADDARERPHLNIICREFDGIGDGELLYVDDSRDERTHDCTPDEFDREDGKTAADIAARYINEEVPVCVEPDVMPGTPSWFSGRDDAEEGTEYYVGLEGFSPAERDAIAAAVKGY